MKVGKNEKYNVFGDDGVVGIKVIEEFAHSMGHEFPTEYKSLLSKHDAVCLEENIFSYIYDDKYLKGDVNFYGYGNKQNPESVNNVQQEDHAVRGVIVIGGTGNGDYICFDFRLNPSEPKIVLMLHDVFESDGKMSILYIADSFEKFIDSLVAEE